MIGPRTGAALCLGALACGPAEAPTEQRAQLELVLHSPAAVDPLAGAEELVVQILTPEGVLLRVESGPADAGLAVQDIEHLGVVVLEITARSDGNVLAAGRSPPVAIDEGFSQVELLFLPINQAVELDHAIAAPRIDHELVPLPSGEVLLLGGRAPSSGEAYSQSDRWHPVQGFSGEGPSLPQGVYQLGLSPFAEGEMLGSGGVDGAGEAVGDAWLLTPDGQRIEPLDRMLHARADHCLARTQSSAALAIGGVEDPPHAVEAYRNGGWTLYLVDALEAPAVSGCASDEQGMVLTLGTEDAAWGVFDLRLSSDNDIPESFYPLPGSQPRLEGAAILAGEQQMWVLGGHDLDAGVQRTGWRLDPIELSLSEELLLPSPRAWADAAWVDADQVVLAGGYADPIRAEPVHELVVMDVHSGAIGLELALPVREGRVVVLPTGYIAVLGGLHSSGRPSGAWVVLPWER